MEDGGVLRIEVDQRHLDFATVACINGARRVEHGDALLGRQPGTRVHQSHVTRRQGDGHAGGHQCPLEGLEGHVDGGDEIGAGIARMRVPEQGRVFGVEAFDQDLGGFGLVVGLVERHQAAHSSHTGWPSSSV